MEIIFFISNASSAGQDHIQWTLPTIFTHSVFNDSSFQTI